MVLGQGKDYAGTLVPTLQLLGRPEDVEKVCLSYRQLGMLGDTDLFLEVVLTRTSTKSIPDGLQAMSLFYEPAAPILDIWLGPPPWHLHDPESHPPGLWVKIIYGLLHRHQGISFLHFGHLGIRHGDMLVKCHTSKELDHLNLHFSSLGAFRLKSPFGDDSSVFCLASCILCGIRLVLLFIIYLLFERFIYFYLH